jgi:hypothetical protein
LGVGFIVANRIQVPVAELAVVTREQIIGEESQFLEKWVNIVQQRGSGLAAKLAVGLIVKGMLSHSGVAGVLIGRTAQ